MKNEKLLKRVAKELNLPVSKVEEVYMSYWTYLKEYIMFFNKSKDITKEEFDQTIHSINIKHIGKIKINYYKYINAKCKKD